MAALGPLLGHQPLVDRFVAQARAGMLHHALLFEGPAGVGKATAAMSLALAANCERGEDRACGRCPTCTSIAAGTHPDVIFLRPAEDSASKTITVDAVREVVRQAGYHRYGAPRRFVVVDPAEALLPAAANALLKTLEEPPSDTYFLLLAVHASSLLPTIVSRCQRQRFGAVAEGEIVGWLIARGAGEPAVRAARLSMGCPGRALDLIDGELVARDALLDEVVAALAGPLAGRQELSAKLADSKKEGGARPPHRPPRGARPGRGPHGGWPRPEAAPRGPAGPPRALGRAPLARRRGPLREGAR